MESRFLEPSVSRTSRYLEPNLVSLGFASLKLYNFTPDFSKLPITRTNFVSRGTNWPSITRTCENFETFVRMSITFTPLNKLTLPDKLLSRILITQQASHKSIISLKGIMTASDYRTEVPLFNCFSEAVLPKKPINFVVPLKWRVHGTCMPSTSPRLTALPFTIAVHEPFSSALKK